MKALGIRRESRDGMYIEDAIYIPETGKAYLAIREGDSVRFNTQTKEQIPSLRMEDYETVASGKVPKRGYLVSSNSRELSDEEIGQLEASLNEEEIFMNGTIPSGEKIKALRIIRNA